MLDAFLFGKGLLLGFSIAAPVGPIGILCIRRTLTNGIASGLTSGLGTAVADALYGCIAAFGITALANLFLENSLYLRLLGGLFLLYLGYGSFTSQPAEQQVAGKIDDSLLHSFSSAFILTLANPMTILSFAALFAGLGVGTTTTNYDAAALMVAGVFCGSLLWWLLLSGSIAWLRTKFHSLNLKWINRISGSILLAFGMTVLLSLV